MPWILDDGRTVQFLDEDPYVLKTPGVCDCRHTDAEHTSKWGRSTRACTVCKCRELKHALDDDMTSRLQREMQARSVMVLSAVDFAGSVLTGLEPGQVKTQTTVQLCLWLRDYALKNKADYDVWALHWLNEFFERVGWSKMRGQPEIDAY